MSMIRTAALALALMAFAAPALAKENTLSAAEKKAGWKLLFDGKSLAGWRGFKTPEPDPGWTAKGGVLSPDPKTSKDIMTKAEFGNFELSFEWRISPKGNSGVMYHVLEKGDETYWSGPEYQVLDNARGEPPLQRAGALYDIYPTIADVPRPVGEFNQSRLVVNHGKVRHWLNGVVVAEYDLNSADFRARVARSKFAQWGLFATGETGHIALQNHGDVVAYRNLKIHELP